MLAVEIKINDGAGDLREAIYQGASYVQAFDWQTDRWHNRAKAEACIARPHLALVATPRSLGLEPYDTIEVARGGLLAHTEANYSINERWAWDLGVAFLRARRSGALFFRVAEAEAFDLGFAL